MKESQIDELEVLAEQTRRANALLDDIKDDREVCLGSPYYAHGAHGLDFCSKEDRALLTNFLRSYVSSRIDRLKEMGVRFE
jgi:hypothetical protein